MTDTNELQSSREEASSASADERNFSVLAHLGTLAGYLIPFGHVGVPLVVWLTKGKDSAHIEEQAKESLNFQISVTVYAVVSGLLCIILIGFLLLPLLVIVNLVCVIKASLWASRGEAYRYPATIRLIT